MNGRSLKNSPLLLVLAGLAASAAALAVSCSKAPPTAPSGSTLTLTVNPTSIPTATGSATAIASLRLPNGTPQPGAQVQFSTTLGTLTPAIANTDNSGNATSRLTGDGRVGTASVSAFSGAVMATGIMVNIGAQASLVTLQAVPASINQTGGTLHLIALVRDAQGNPVPDSPVNFSTQAGTLASGGGFVYTDATGTATDTLKVSSGDLVNQTGTSFNVSVQGATGSAVTFAVSIARPPKANFTANVVSGSLTVSFTDTSTNNPTSWLWNFGDGTQSTEESPVHTYTLTNGGTSQTFAVSLTATNGAGSNTFSETITVTTQ